MTVRTPVYLDHHATTPPDPRVFEVLDTPEEVTSKPNAVRLPKARGSVRFENVSFSYDPGDVVLQNVSFEAKPGECIAILAQPARAKAR